MKCFAVRRSVLIVAAVQRGLIRAVAAVAGLMPNRRWGLLLARRSEGFFTPLVSIRRRLFSMRASRAFTSSNSDVVTSVLIPGRQDAGNLFLRVQDAVGSLRVVGECLGYQARLALFKSLNLLKEADEGLRIVAGAVHVLHAQVVGLRLELARELQEGDRNGQLRGFVNAVAGPA